MMMPPEPYPDCATCEEEYLKQFEDTNPSRYVSRRMILCPACGNKRCPKATYHGEECTASNATGQPGSRYGGF